jgi:hypothetical protein
MLGSVRWDAALWVVASVGVSVLLLGAAAFWGMGVAVSRMVGSRSLLWVRGPVLVSVPQIANPFCAHAPESSRV